MSTGAPFSIVGIGASAGAFSGMTARFEIPLPPAMEEQPCRRQRQRRGTISPLSGCRKGTRMSRLRALVAEDSALLLFGVELLLSQRDIEIVGAAGTLTSLRKLAESVAADIAILDV